MKVMKQLTQYRALLDTLSTKAGDYVNARERDEHVEQEVRDIEDGDNKERMARLVEASNTALGSMKVNVRLLETKLAAAKNELKVASNRAEILMVEAHEENQRKSIQTRQQRTNSRLRRYADQDAELKRLFKKVRSI